MEENRRIRRGRMVFTVIFTMLSAGASIFCGNVDMRMGGFYTESAPLLLAGGLCGNLPGIITVLLTFIYRAIFDTTTSYRIALYLMAVLVTALATRHRVFRSMIKTLLLGLFTAVMIGGMNGLLVSLVMSGHFSPGMTGDMLRSCTYELPESMGSMLLLYLLFRFLPDRVKVLIPNGMYYLDDQASGYADIAADIETARGESMSRLSFRITRVIILEAIILSISAAVFAIHLVSILNERPGRPQGAVSQNSASNSMGAGGQGREPSAGNEGEVPPEKPEGEVPPEKPEVEEPPAGAEREEPPEKPGENPPGNEREPRPVGILGQRLEDTVSSNELFNDDMHFNPFERRDGMSARAALAFALRLCMILFTIGVVTAALADAYMQLSVARPIRKMSEAMKGFAFSDRDGSIGGTEELAAIKVQSRDEIEELYRALVKTVADTEDYLERLREEDRIRNELEVAKASSDAKSAFLSSMSHEIRTPINAVLGFDEMILMENKDPEIGKYAEDIQSAGKTLLALINDILDFSKIEAGKMDIVPVEYELTSTINDVVSMTMSLANDKGLSFDVKVDPKTPHLLKGDEIRIKQCMTNILSNAVKYTEHGGLTLTVGFEKVNEGSIRLMVSVKDTGIGIREEDMEKLFSAFDRLDQVRNKAVKGTGLGMSITKQLLESMGSELEVESEYEKGSNFHFAVMQEVTEWEEIGDLSEAFKKYIPHDTGAHLKDNFYAPEADILVTDDTENNLLVVTRLLKRTGIRIDTADSGMKTLELIRQKKYDIIYLDHMMPEMDGIETLHRMNGLQDNLNSKTPVIVLTANAVSGSREMYIKEGFTDYMTKPVSYQTLKESLIKYLPGEKIGTKEEEEESSEAPDSIFPAEIQGIDLEEGIRNSGDEETLKEVMGGFLEGIEEASARIERELSELLIKDYTVHVHALKSSARLIGAMELSSMALEMENTGNAYLKAKASDDDKGAEEALAKLKAETPALLSLYRSYTGRLSPVIKAEGSGETKEELPPISEEELKEMLSGIKEFAEAFDMDTVDMVMGQIEGRRVPEKMKELTASLKKAVRNVDRDGILSLLSELE